MCGICGEFNFISSGAVLEERLERMTSMLAHRGPDDQGTYLADPPIFGMGQRRLSIIDLSGGSQPMCNEDGSIWVAFNGEIYNFPELRQDLVNRGHQFRTDSDTEVIIHQYEEDGPRCLDRFNGMFAFAIWDCRDRSLFLARDRLGIKPLYYTIDSGRFIFASEVRPIVFALGSAPPLDPAAVWSFLAIQYAPAPRTMFEGISELEPGHYLRVDSSGPRKKRYWSLPEDAPPIARRRAEESIRSMLDDSVKKRLIADVPLGAFLSGGIDSTAIVSSMRRERSGGIKTFSVDFHAEDGAGYVNETKWSALAAKTYGTDHYALTVSAADAVEALPAVVERLDDLISDPAVIPTYLVSRFAREQVKVALSGEGGDELFAGYQRYRLGSLARYYRPIPAALRSLLFERPASMLPHARRLRKGIAALSPDTPAARHLHWLLVLPPDAIDALVGKGTGGPELCRGIFEKHFPPGGRVFDLERELRADIGTWLPDDLLTKVDRASMAVGLECRVPFLDHRMVELALRVPAGEKAGLFGSKTVLKRAMAGRVPLDIINRKKAGFTLPLDQWFRLELREMMLDYLSPERLRSEGTFDPWAAGALVEEHLSGRENQGHQLFSLLIFQMWRDSMKRLPPAGGN